ncbi:MAG: methylenetetrahydrofolate reductase (NADPH) [Candidatus Azotimanducaceae bacterium]|jgi:methylenetetrahydrofolate reductase (NADPH)
MLDNSLQQRLCSDEPLFSIEFFPPKSDASAEQLLRTAKDLKVYSPDFASITYGAGGSTRSRTLKYARHLSEDYGYNVMPHLTCVGHSRDELRGIIAEFREAGLGQIMALRGDPPKGETDFKPHPDGLHHANELVQLINETYPECIIGVAGYPEMHPEAPSPEIDLLNLKRKVDTGAHFVTTQLFFDNNKYFEFVERARQAKIEVPILPGLMCVTSREQALRFCEMCGTSMPAELDERLAAAGDDKERIEAVGIQWVYEQARELLERGAPGIHLYILNRQGPAVTLLEKLKAVGFYKV